MRYLVISDIHGNLPALAAVLRDCPPENLRSRAGARRSRRLRRRTWRGDRPHPRACAARGRARQSRQGRLRRDGPAGLQLARPRSGRVDDAARSPSRTSPICAICPPGLCWSTTCSRCGTAPRPTKTRTWCGSTTSAMRRRSGVGRCACSGTRTCRARTVLARATRLSRAATRGRARRCRFASRTAG